MPSLFAIGGWLRRRPLATIARTKEDVERVLPPPLGPGTVLRRYLWVLLEREGIAVTPAIASELDHVAQALDAIDQVVSSDDGLRDRVARVTARVDALETLREAERRALASPWRGQSQGN